MIELYYWKKILSTILQDMMCCNIKATSIQTFVIFISHQRWGDKPMEMEFNEIEKILPTSCISYKNRIKIPQQTNSIKKESKVYRRRVARIRFRGGHTGIPPPPHIQTQNMLYFIYCIQEIFGGANRAVTKAL